MLKLGNFLSTSKAVIAKYVKDKLKLYVNFDKNRAKTQTFVGTGSCSFDGTNDYITYTDSDVKSSLEGIDTLTIMGWCRRDATNGTIVNKGSYGATSTEFGMQFQEHIEGTGASDGRWRFSIANSFNTWSSAPSDIKTGDVGSGATYVPIWHHYAITYNKNAGSTTEAATMYIDGQVVTDTPAGSLASVGTYGTNITIGSTSTGANDLNGNIKNVGIWNRVLNQSEILTVMNKQYSKLRGSELNGLQFWADLDSDLNAKNNSGNTITGTASNNAAIVSGIYNNNVPRIPRVYDNAPTTKPDLIGDGSCVFNGTSDYITMGNTLNTGTTDFSISFWAKISASAPQGVAGIIAKKPSLNAGDAGWMIGLKKHTNNTLQFYGYLDDGGGVKGNYGDMFLEENTWYHVVAVWDRDDDLSIYIDGSIDANGTDISADTDTLNNTSQFIIGKQLGQEEFAGNIAQVGFWSRILTQAEIISIQEKTYSDLSDSEKVSLESWWGLDSDLNTKGSLDVIADSVSSATTEHINISGITNTIGAPDTGGTAFCYFRVASGGLTALESGGEPNWTISGTVNTWNDLVAGTTYKCELTSGSSFSTANGGRVDEWDLNVGSSNVLLSTANATAGNTHTVYFHADSDLTSFKLALYNVNAITSIVISRHNGNIGALL